MPLKKHLHITGHNNQNSERELNGYIVEYFIVWGFMGDVIMFFVCPQEGRATVNQDTKLDNRVIDLRVSCSLSRGKTSEKNPEYVTKPAEYLS